MKPTIIAFTGPMGAGKSEAIQTLREFRKQSGYIPDSNVILVKFAQPLYDMQEFIYNRVESVFQRPDDFIKDRFLLQWLGTEWGRNTIDKDLWVKLWVAAVQQIAKRNPSAVIVCDDCRFDNEAEVVKSVGGIIVKISTAKNGERIDTSRATHASEAGISFQYVDYLIENNDTLEHYKNQLTYLYNKLGL